MKPATTTVEVACPLCDTTIELSMTIRTRAEIERDPHTGKREAVIALIPDIDTGPLVEHRAAVRPIEEAE